jgi:hypothetical protein
MNNMALHIRLMQSSDTEQLRRLYERFALNFVGSVKRQAKQFQSMTRKKDNLRWVALDEQGEIVGYISAAYTKGRRTGRIIEIVTDPKYDFETVARPLIDKIYSVFMEKGAAQIQVGTIQNSDYSKIFPKLGFWHIKTDGVFMYVITDIAKFLGEITPIIVQRLKRLSDWNGLLQISCENHGRLFKKEGEIVAAVSSTNHPLDCQITLPVNALTRLLLGATDIQKAFAENLIRVETTLPKKKTMELLDSLFPRKQFLALDYW